MSDEYDDGDDLFADVDPDELLSTKKRPREDDSGNWVDPGSPNTHLLKRAKPNSHDSQDSQDARNVSLARDILSEKFGYKSFRHEQEKAIASVLRGENTLVVFPTGAGKSLCYQVGSSRLDDRGKPLADSR
jgi:hypothetical protein